MGRYLYRTQCPRCNACEPIRLAVDQFRPNRSQRRTWRKTNPLVSMKVARPSCDSQRLDLFNKHKQLRDLDRGEPPMDAVGYREFLVATCCDTLELSFWHDRRLLAVAVSDRGETSLNAVYCFYDPDWQEYGLGTYNVLAQIELCRQWGLQYLYLGLFIAASSHMNYKANFLPHERLIDNAWQPFERE